MKTYLVTGCAGFIGSNFVHYMLEKYQDIRLVNLDKLTYAGNLENLEDIKDDARHIFVKGDICDKALVTDLIAKYEPDYVIVQDVTLLDVVDVAGGLKPTGKIIINTDRPKEALKLKTEAEVITIDATKIAMEILKRPIVNTTMLGAFCGASKEVGLQSLNKAISERFKGELGNKNLLAIKTAYEMVS